MPMTTDQSTKHGTLGGAGANLQTAIENYAAKAATLVAAQAAADAAKTQLDTAVVSFKAADTAFENAFPLPAGYTPPSP